MPPALTSGEGVLGVRLRGIRAGQGEPPDRRVTANPLNAKEYLLALARVRRG
jgi:hypothetical protein